MKANNLDETYNVWSEFYDEFDNPLIPIEEMAVRSLLRTIKFQDVLDAATGTGRQAIYLAQRGKRVAATDCNEKMLFKAREKASAEGLDIDFRLENLSKISFEDNSFDLVICALALAHVKDLTIPCQEFKRVLRPGGNLIITDLHPFAQNGMGSEYEWELIEGQAPVFFPNFHSNVDDYLEAVKLAGTELVAVLDIPMNFKEELFPGALIVWARKTEE
jgi:ubiquinone/menaquinone biosynthesis C-methylase UbiE